MSTVDIMVGHDDGSLMSGRCYVHIGPAVVRVYGGWLGYASGNRPCQKVRKSPATALRDAGKLEAGHAKEALE